MGVATKSRTRVWRVAPALRPALLAASAPAHAQVADFPSRPITLLVPFAAGGSSDVVMRLVSQARVGDASSRPS